MKQLDSTEEVDWEILSITKEFAIETYKSTCLKLSREFKILYKTITKVFDINLEKHIWNQRICTCKQRLYIQYLPEICRFYSDVDWYMEY